MNKKIALKLATISGLLLITGVSFAAPMNQGCNVTDPSTVCQINLYSPRLASVPYRKV